MASSKSKLHFQTIKNLFTVMYYCSVIHCHHVNKNKQMQTFLVPCNDDDRDDDDDNDNSGNDDDDDDDNDNEYDDDINDR